jgi:hypothetical protein
MGILDDRVTIVTGTGPAAGIGAAIAERPGPPAEFGERRDDGSCDRRCR